MALDKKRREPEDVAAVEAEGLLFEAPLAGVPLGYEQDGGIVTARDLAAGQLVGMQRVSAIDHSAPIEGDKQEVYITRLGLSSDGATLWVDNERGERYPLSLFERSVEQVVV